MTANLSLLDLEELANPFHDRTCLTPQRLPGRQVGSRANWPRTQIAEYALSGVRRPGEPNLRPPFERISDPQIPLTRQKIYGTHAERRGANCRNSTA